MLRTTTNWGMRTLSLFSISRTMPLHDVAATPAEKGQKPSFVIRCKPHETDLWVPSGFHITSLSCLLH